MAPVQLLLHMSDLHFGPHSRFDTKDPAGLARSTAESIRHATSSANVHEPVDAIVVTGDVTEAGTAPQFADAQRFLEGIGGKLGVPHERIVVVPGNHDVSWQRCQIACRQQEQEGFDDDERERRIADTKLAEFGLFLQRMYEATPDKRSDVCPLGGGAYVYDFSSSGLAIAALNSCERESHRSSDHVGFLGDTQTAALMGHWAASAPTDLIRCDAPPTIRRDCPVRGQRGQAGYGGETKRLDMKQWDGVQDVGPRTC